MKINKSIKPLIHKPKFVKYFKINRLKEKRDINVLIELLRPIVKKNTIIVNCSPDYSSIISQQIIHAYFDNPLQMVNFEMPFPKTPFEQLYPKICADFAINLCPTNEYIFIDSGVLRGKNYSTLDYSMFIHALKDIKYTFASLYVQDNAVFTPQFYVETFNKKKQGMLLFWWENDKCTLFD
jgi:hypothetical protein